MNVYIAKESILFCSKNIPRVFPKYLRKPENKDFFFSKYLNVFRAMAILEENIQVMFGAAAFLGRLHLI